MCDKPRISLTGWCDDLALFCSSMHNAASATNLNDIHAALRDCFDRLSLYGEILALSMFLDRATISVVSETQSKVEACGGDVFPCFFSWFLFPHELNRLFHNPSLPSLQTAKSSCFHAQLLNHYSLP